MILKEYIPFYKRNLQVAVPVMISQAGQVVVNLADNIMVGHLGAPQLAGVSFANAVFMIGMAITIGFCQGITPLVGQAFGKGDDNGVARLMSNSFFLNVILNFVLMIIMLIVGMMMGNMGQEAEVVEYAKKYYFISVAGMIPSVIFFTLRFCSEGIGNTKNVMWITIGINLLNIFLNWVLIYGNLGAPRLGVAGAAYATLISRILGAIALMFFYYIFKEYNHFLKLLQHHFIERETIKSLLKISAPTSLQSLLEVSAFCFAAIMVGWMGKYELAGHQIAQSLSYLTFMVATGIGSAATIRVSHQFGAGRYGDLKMAGKAAMHMSVAMMGVSGVLFIIFHNFIPFLYTSDPKAIEVASKLIIVMSLYQVFDALQVATLSVLRGLKDINRPLLYSFISYFIICLPSGYLLGFICGLGPIGVWIGLLIGLAAGAILFYIRFQKITKKLLSSPQQTHFAAVQHLGGNK